MDIKIVEDKISLQELREVAKEFYSTMIKGVVDVEKEIAAFGGEYHADALAKDALARAHNILAEIKALPDMKTRLQEIDALSKVIENIVESKSAFRIPFEHIKSYFLPFSLRLMAV